MLPTPCPVCERPAPEQGPYKGNCGCGIAVFTDGVGWAISFDWIARLTRTLQSLHPETYNALMASLSVEIPEDLTRLLKAARNALH